MSISSTNPAAFASSSTLVFRALILTEGQEEPVAVRSAGDGVFDCDYYPVVVGKYLITITWGGHSIPRR